MTTSNSADYLDEHATNLLVEYPECGEYISELLTKYKKTLEDGSVNIGTPEEVILSFENDVRKRCLRTKAGSTDKPLIRGRK